MASGKKGRPRQHGVAGGRSIVAGVAPAGRPLGRLRLGQSLLDNVTPTGSLQEEARNTQHHHSSWTPELRLRHDKVSFVTALQTTLPEPTEVDVQDEMGTLILNDHHRLLSDDNQGGSALEGLNTTDKENCPFPQRSQPSESPRHIQTGQVESPLAAFVVDVDGSRIPPDTGFEDPVARSPSPTLSISSGDVVLFAGRGKRNQELKRRSVLTEERNDAAYSQSRQGLYSSEGLPKSPTALSDSRPSLIDAASQGACIVSPHRSMKSDPANLDGGLNREIITGVGINASHPRRNPALSSTQIGRRKKEKQAKAAAEEAGLLDYVANLRHSGLGEQADMQRLAVGRDLGGSDLETTSRPRKAGSSPKMVPHMHQHELWKNTYLADLGNLSTSEETHEVIQDILGKRTRARGVQYLIVWEGDTVDDARWIATSALTMEGAAEKIQSYEEREETHPAWHSASLTDSDSASDRLGASEVDPEQPDGRLSDVEGAIGRGIADLTDEKLAQLLSKQEELGMGSEELVLLDDEAFEQARLGVLTRKGRNPRASRTHGSSRKSPPRYTMDTSTVGRFAVDACDNLDMMDWDRPSLTKSSRKSQAPLPLDLSDSELESQLRSSWAADRQKKRLQKTEREKLRAQGLLGRKNQKKPDLKSKYSEGMTMDAIKHEVREFLLANQQSIALPPMDKRDRKLVHTIATAVGLKSKSVGGGGSRFPTLYKTARTQSAEGDSLDRVSSRLQKRFMPRLDRGAKRGAVGRNNIGSKSNSAAYRDGEVVGAAAPELGQENRGRAILEKMGWSTGTALGALDNKGILQPVTHVVKVSKAGLG